MSIGQFIPKKYLQVVESGKVTWSSPSNIALVKYWGKEGNQIPKNPSVSLH
jgi:diphosphomevalonate decarboxylase